VVALGQSGEINTNVVLNCGFGRDGFCFVRSKEEATEK